MVRLSTIVLVFTVIIAATTQWAVALGAHDPTPVGQDGDWTLIFHDEFEDDSFDTDLWVTCYWWDDGGCTNLGNRNLNWYLPENVIVQDGALHLRALEEEVVGSDGATYVYTSGMVTTGSTVDDPSAPTKFTFRYGYAEIRAQLPAGQGLWPAFWMLPDSQTSRPEIDVMEFLGQDVTSIRMSMHYRDSSDERRRVTTFFDGADFTDGWHIFAVDWTPEAVVWYIDGVERFRYEEEYVPDVDMYILLNLAVGGDYPGSPDADTPFPSDFVIDYVRVWSHGT